MDCRGLGRALVPLCTQRRGSPRVPSRPLEPVRLLRDHPVLLLAGPPPTGRLDGLLSGWNPAAAPDPRGVLRIADAVSWYGPLPLDPALAARCGLPGGWSTAYAARTPQRRMRPRDPGDPAGRPENLASCLVGGLARHLGGLVRLPGQSPRSVAGTDAVLCVYGHEALPWQILRSLLAGALPGLTRNGAAAANDYCVERRDAVEVRVLPFGPESFVPYALREQAGDGWPGTIYRFRLLGSHGETDLRVLTGQIRAGAVLLAELVGGILLDAEGFPVEAPPVPGGVQETV
jgi:hypothetical protein